MDRAGSKAPSLFHDELVKLFEIVGNGGDLKEARRNLEERGRTTIAKAFNVIRQLDPKGPTLLDDAGAKGIAQKAKYGTTPSYVQDLHRKWWSWERRESSAPIPRNTLSWLEGRAVLRLLGDSLRTCIVQ